MAHFLCEDFNLAIRHLSNIKFHMKFFICNNFLLITFILAVVNISSNGNNFTAKLTIVATANIVTAVK